MWNAFVCFQYNSKRPRRKAASKNNRVKKRRVIESGSEGDSEGMLVTNSNRLKGNCEEIIKASLPSVTNTLYMVLNLTCNIIWHETGQTGVQPSYCLPGK